MTTKTASLAALSAAGLRVPLWTLVPACTPPAAVLAMLRDIEAAMATVGELLLVEPDGHGEARAVDDLDDDGHDDDCGSIELRGDWCRRALGVVDHVMRRGSQPRDVCVRSDHANGRIGLMLRRCPPVVAYVDASSTLPSLLAAHLRGSVPPPPAQPETTTAPARQHLEADVGPHSTGAELLVRARAGVADWGLALLWSAQPASSTPELLCGRPRSWR